MIQQVTAALPDAQALTTFLTVEGFLLATVSLSVTLGAPGLRRPAPLPTSARHLAMGAACLSVVVGVAGIAAWVGLYSEGIILPLRQLFIAIVLLTAVIAQPVIAFFLALGAGTRV